MFIFAFNKLRRATPLSINMRKIKSGAIENDVHPPVGIVWSFTISKIISGDGCWSQHIPINKIILWSDSTIVLHWIRLTPDVLKPYIGNRVNEIQNTCERGTWRHVRSNDNPADAVSRGQLPSTFLRNDLWHKGPNWLNHSEEKWPVQSIPSLNDVPELRKGVYLVINAKMDTEIFKRFSSYSSMKRIIAYCLRFRPSNHYRGLC